MNATSKRTKQRTARRIQELDPTSRPRAAALPRRTTDSATRKQLAAGPAPSPAQGAVKLDIASAQAPALMALTMKIRDGLTANVYYPDLTSTLAAFTAS